MKDDAVAPVIAVMLILAAVVTFLTVWNGIYVPSMKQSAEVGHLQNVESAFLHFSSDIERAVSARQNLTLSEPVQLGGGDFFFNALRSSGSLAVQNEQKPIYYLTLDDDEDPNTVLEEMDGSLVNISYSPIGNFWQDQGYRWQYGYLNVTKYRTKQTPLGYYNMTGVSNEFEGSGSLAIFAGSFGGVDYTVNQTFFQNATPTPDNRYTFSPRAGNCSGIVLWAVNMSASPDHQFVSSNGFGTLALKSHVITVPYYGVQNISIGSGREPFGNAMFRNWNSSLASLAGKCEGNIQYNPDKSFDDFSLYTIKQQVNPVNVTLNIVTIEIGAY
ncbi:MAG: hypothetical protein STSR0009_20050 [Methanoregula sp.]